MANPVSNDHKFLKAVEDALEVERKASELARQRAADLERTLVAPAAVLTDAAIADALRNGVRPRHVHAIGLGTQNPNRVYGVKATLSARDEVAVVTRKAYVSEDEHVDFNLDVLGTKTYTLVTASGVEVGLDFDPLRLTAKAQESDEQSIVDRNWQLIFDFVLENTTGFVADEVLPLGGTEFRNESEAFLAERTKRRPVGVEAVEFADDDEFGEE
jgi:hypothetical protein